MGKKQNMLHMVPVSIKDAEVGSVYAPCTEEEKILGLSLLHVYGEVTIDH